MTFLRNVNALDIQDRSVEDRRQCALAWARRRRYRGFMPHLQSSRRARTRPLQRPDGGQDDAGRTAVTQVVKAPDGRTLPVESWGDPDGKPVFLLHGTPGGRYGPRPRGIVLYRLGIRLISYDRPGYPHSTRKINRT